MKHSQLKRIAHGVLLGCVAQLALPALASDVPALALRQPRPLATAVEQQTRAAVASAPRFTQDASATAASDSKPFLKSPKGIAVILLMAAGTGYAIYAATNQRISNPLR